MRVNQSLAHTLAVLYIYLCKINTNTNIILLTRIVKKIIRLERFVIIWVQRVISMDVLCSRIVIMGLSKASTFLSMARKVAKIG